MTEWQIVHDSRIERPEIVDKTSSAFVVYERRNIKQEVRQDEMSGQGVLEWTYEQRTFTKEEYAAFEVDLVHKKVTQTLAALEDVICEQDIANNKRMNVIEDAICELDTAINGGDTDDK